MKSVNYTTNAVKCESQQKSNSCQEKNLKKARIYYLNKKTHNVERVFDKLYRDETIITRANNPDKKISRAARLILSNIEQLILKSRNQKIIIDHDLLTEITNCQPRQNCNLLAELKDIFNFKYHNFKIFEGKKYSYCYEISFTNDGEKRVSNPALFYDLESNLLPVSPQKITASNIRDIEEDNIFLPKERNILSSKEISTVVNYNAHVREEKPQESLPPIENDATTMKSHHPQLVTSQKIPQFKEEPAITREQILTDKLFKLIHKTFSADLANEFTSKITFSWDLGTNKLKLIFKENYLLNALHKPLLRTLFIEVYGESVHITTSPPSIPEEKKESGEQKSNEFIQSSVVNTKPMRELSLWEKVRVELRQYIGVDYERIYFSKAIITELEEEKLMFTAESPGLLHHIRIHHALNLFKSFKTYAYKPALDYNYNKEGIVFEPIKGEK